MLCSTKCCFVKRDEEEGEARQKGVGRRQIGMEGPKSAIRWAQGSLTRSESKPCTLPPWLGSTALIGPEPRRLHTPPGCVCKHPGCCAAAPAPPASHSGWAHRSLPPSPTSTFICSGARNEPPGLLSPSPCFASLSALAARTGRSKGSPFSPAHGGARARPCIALQYSALEVHRIGLQCSAEQFRPRAASVPPLSDRTAAIPFASRKPVASLPTGECTVP